MSSEAEQAEIENRRARLVDAAVADGRFGPTRRVFWLNQLRADPTAERTLASLAAVPELRPTDNPRSAARRTPPPTAGSSTGGRFPSASAATVVTSARVPGALARASARGPEPRLFGQSDRPKLLASGLDPSIVDAVPWTARAAVAEAPTPAEVYRIVDEFRGLSGQVAEDYAAVNYGGHPANAEYVRATEQWVVAGMSDGELYGSIYGTPGE